jgi:hypothetical protein
MAKISENLLKLADFPFSYSLVGGLFIILTGENINLSNITSSEYLPLLTIMSFLGTALTICDPFGRLIKIIELLLSRKDLPRINVGRLSSKDLDTLERISGVIYRAINPPEYADERLLRQAQFEIQEQKIKIEKLLEEDDDATRRPTVEGGI